MTLQTESTSEHWRLWLEERGDWDACDTLLDIGSRYLARFHQGTKTGLFIAGSVGCGKTHLTRQICKAIGDNSWIDAKDTPLEYKTDETAYRYYVENLRVLGMVNIGEPYIPLTIVIDDMGAETTLNNYGVMVEPVAEAIAIRSAIDDGKQLPLLITSNLPMRHDDPAVMTISKRYGERTTSRINGLCWITNVNGPDRRGEGKGKL